MTLATPAADSVRGRTRTPARPGPGPTPEALLRWWDPRWSVCDACNQKVAHRDQTADDQTGCGLTQ